MQCLFWKNGMELTTLVMTKTPETNTPTLPLKKKKCQILPRVLQDTYRLQRIHVTPNDKSKLMIPLLCCSVIIYYINFLIIK